MAVDGEPYKARNIDIVDPDNHVWLPRSWCVWRGRVLQALKSPLSLDVNRCGRFNPFWARETIREVITRSVRHRHVAKVTPPSWPCPSHFCSHRRTGRWIARRKAGVTAMHNDAQLPPSSELSYL